MVRQSTTNHLLQGEFTWYQWQAEKNSSKEEKGSLIFNHVPVHYK